MRPLSDRPLNSTSSLTGALARAAATAPGAVALAVDGGRELTFAAWERRSSAAAAGLANVAGPGARIALLFDSMGWDDYAVAYLAVVKAGAVPVLLPPALSEIELSRPMRDCGPSALVVAAPELAPRAAEPPVVQLAELERRDDGASFTRDALAAGDVAEVVYLPHPLSHPVPLARTHADLAAALPPPPLLHAFPPGTLAAQEALRGSLEPGGSGSLVLPRLHPERLCTLIEATPARACGLHPATAEGLLGSDAPRRHDVSRLQRLALVSDRIAPTLARRLRAVFPQAEMLTIELPRAARRPVPSASRAQTPEPPAAEDTVASVFERVLRRKPVARDADFFALGGDAAAAAAVLRLLEDAFGLRVPAEALLAAPTISGLADALARLRARPAAGADLAGSAAPVAFSQEGMLWHELFAPGSQNLPGLARRYRGPLDIAALSRAIDEIVRRHGALRTSFELREGRPVQVVRPHHSLELPVHDLTELGEAERAEAVADAVAQAGGRSFDLVEDPLFVPTLLRLGEHDHVLVIRTHHSVFDDWSVGVFRRQLAKLYNAFAAGNASPLPEPAPQFADFSKRQRASLAGPAGTRELAFWRRELHDAPLTVQLPVDDPAAPAGTPQPGGETVERRLASDLHQRLRELSRRERASVFMTLLAGFGVLIQRYTGQADLLIATVVANRNRTELEGMIGCFTKKVTLRLRLDGDPTFTELLARVRTALLEALSHQDLPFEAVVQDVLGADAAAHGVVPHIPIMFQGVTPHQELVLEGVQSAGLETAARAGRAHFMAGPEDRAGELPPLPWGAGMYAGTFVILTVDESEAGLSCTARGALHPPAVRDLLERFVTLLGDIAADPSRPISELAVLDAAAEREVLERGRGPAASARARSLPDALRNQARRDPGAPALRTGTHALSYAELDDWTDRLAERLRGLGAEPGGRIATLLGTSPELIAAVLAIWKAGAAWVGLDPEDSPARRRRIVEDGAVGLVVDDDTLKALGDAPPTRDAAPAGMAEAAAVFYGVGSPDVQQGVVIGHGALLNLLSGPGNALEDGRPHRTCLCPRPTDDAFLRRLVGMVGGDCLHIPEHPLAVDPTETLGLLRAGEVDLVDATPEELRALLDAGLSDGLPDGVRAVVAVGTRTAMAPELWRALRSVSGVRARIVYGPPQCAFAVTTGEELARGVGAPLANLAVSVRDGGGRPVPLGAIGELHVEGAGVRPAPTGQRARLLADGNVELLGAVSDDRDLRGFRVEPERIEAALADLPGLDRVRVVLERDEHKNPHLVAHVVIRGAPPTLAAVRAWVWERLPGYAWPERMVVSHAPSEGESGTAPLSPKEPAPAEQTILCALWSDELGLGPVGPQANYWQAFSFIEALARAKESGVPIAGEDVTRNRTLGALAAAIRRPRG